MQELYVTVGTDGWTIDLQAKNGFLMDLPHPRMLGTFTRWLGTYVREKKLMSWEEAIHRMTGLSASILGLKDRGVLAEGKFADIAVIDPNKVAARATFPDPYHYSEGVVYLFVNGGTVVDDGKVTAALPGRALRGPGYNKTSH